jgi:hypothetical protein
MKKWIQIALAVLLVGSGVRLAWIFYQRSQPVQAPSRQQVTYSSNEDDYVAPHKIYAYDLKSAKKELVGKTVWVIAGNSLYYYPYASGVASLQHKAGVLAPLEKLDIRDIVLQKTSSAPRPGEFVVVRQQIMAVFRKADQPATYAVDIGTSVGGNYKFIANQEFLIDDPHELYKHWPSDVWSAIDHHEAKPGMNELQVGFALGTSATAGAGDYGNRFMEYTNAGKPVTVTFSGNKATQVVPGPSK